MKKFHMILAVAVLMVFVLIAPVYAKVTFGSTQMTPVAEREFLLNQLSAFSKSSGISIELLNFEYPDLLSRLEAEHKTGKITINLVADLQSNLYIMASEGLFEDLKNVTIPGRTFIKTFEQYSYQGNQKVFIPWIQATYVMAINKKAFDYLPSGLKKEDVMNGTQKWTYDALLAWSKNLMEKTKAPQLGFPLGPKSLWHRFLHGCIYPSYTGAQASKFDSGEALTMWTYLKNLFKYVHPACTTWDNMDQPLLRNEVMIAWDHTARVKQAVVERPNDFVIAPVPRGPKGRGYLVVLTGLSIPKGAPNMDESIKVIDFLTSPKTQVAILENVGFFPVIQEASAAMPEGALKILTQGVVTQSSAADSIVCIAPGLGAYGGEFNEIYRSAFDRIVFKNEATSKVLTELSQRLKKIFTQAGVPIE